MSVKCRISSAIGSMSLSPPIGIFSGWFGLAAWFDWRKAGRVSIGESAMYNRCSSRVLSLLLLICGAAGGAGGCPMLAQF